MNPFKYIFWYYYKAPFDLLKIWQNFLKFFWSYFLPIPQLLKTLFSPWRRDITRYSYKVYGFDPKILLQTIAFNLVSRSIGFLVRFLSIIFVIALEMSLLVFGIALFIFWFTWPLIFLVSLFLFYKNVSLLFLLAVVIVLFLIFTVLSFKTAQERPVEQLTLKVIFGQEWSNVIWERIGLNRNEIPEDVLFNPDEKLKDFLKQKDIKEKDFETAFKWETDIQKENYLKKRFWREENLFNFRGFAKDWTYGYTPLLEWYARPINVLASYEHLIGREQELSLLERELSKSRQSNVLVIGEHGVGKMSLVQRFAQLVEEGKVVPNLAYRRVILLDLKQALAGLTNLGQLEEQIVKIFTQAQASGNIILVINDFHNFVSASISMGLGEKNLSRILIPFLEGGYFQLIALTTYQGLHEHIEKSELLKYFEKVEVKELEKETVEKICQDSVKEIESEIPVRITIQAIRGIVERSDLLITDVPFPEKAIDLLEETAIYVAQKTSDYIVIPLHVDQVVSQKTEVPVGQLEMDEKEKLLNLETFLHKRVINQDQAINDIASAMRRGRLEIGEKRRPIGSFLFLGPTGVGKTETAKALAESYFGSEERMNRFDMSEFQGISAVEKIIGSIHTNAPGLLTTTVKENPFSLLLLDEIEKADSGVINLFLQVLEEGWLTDALGRKINFRNQIIIATSNAAAEFIRQKIKENIDEESLKKQLIDYILKQNLFRPEFLNRFDGVIVFKPLTPSNLIEISRLMLSGLKNRLQKQDLIFEFGEGLVSKIAELGYDPENGARPMRRVIQKKVEDLIAKQLLKSEIQKEVPFEIKVEEIL